MPRRFTVGVLGATGLVGQQVLPFLDKHPWFDVAWLAGSEQSVGSPYAEATEWLIDDPMPEWAGPMIVKSCDPSLDADVVISALDASVAHDIELACAAAGRAVVSNASCHRLAPDIPLVVPEVNADHLDIIPLQRERRGWERGCLATNPNCSTVGIALAVAPIARAISRLTVTTVQAASGAGRTGLVAFQGMKNAVPFIKDEERKIREETLKIFGDIQHGSIVSNATMHVVATCSRGSAKFGHLAFVNADFCVPKSRDTLLAAWSEETAPALRLPSLPRHATVYLEDDDRPQPLLDCNRDRGMAVSIGRLRNEFVDGPFMCCDWRFVALVDNLKRGAGGGAVSIAELLASRGFVH